MLLQLKQGLKVLILYKVYIFVQMCAYLVWKFIIEVLTSEICYVYSKHWTLFSELKCKFTN